MQTLNSLFEDKTVDFVETISATEILVGRTDTYTHPTHLRFHFKDGTCADIYINHGNGISSDSTAYMDYDYK